MAKPGEDDRFTSLKVTSCQMGLLTSSGVMVTLLLVDVLTIKSFISNSSILLMAFDLIWTKHSKFWLLIQSHKHYHAFSMVTTGHSYEGVLHWSILTLGVGYESVFEKLSNYCNIIILSITHEKSSWLNEFKYNDI